MKTRIALLACLALALAACKGEQKKETGGTAQGEILPGSASDAMLPLDTVKSQAPLAPKADGGAKSAGGKVVSIVGTGGGGAAAAGSSTSSITASASTTAQPAPVPVTRTPSPPSTPPSSAA